MNKTDSQNNKNLVHYCQRLASLNVSSTRKKGNAPYKPILLLAVIDLVAQNVIQENMIFVSEELISAFKKYWSFLAPEYDGGLHYPFFHLQNEGFWHLKLQPNFNGLQPKTTNKLKQAVQYATIDQELFNLIQDPFSRKELIDTLLGVWFSSAQKEFEDILSVNEILQSSVSEEDKTISNDEKIVNQPKFYLKNSIIRDAFFRKTIVHIYKYRCSFCGLKVIHSITQSIVDGAHIKPFSEFYDNNVNNGICLCKNHHWAFDQGLFSLDDDYKILVARDFIEESPNAKPLSDFQNEILILPESERYLPRLEAIQWHRANIFKT